MTDVDGNRLLRGVFWTRLGAAGVLLTLGWVLPTDFMPDVSHLALGLALLAVVVSSVAMLLTLPVARPHRIAWFIALLDVTLVTAIVAATGGARSMFTFLYVIHVTASCLTLSRTGGLTIAAVSSLLYTALVAGRTVFPIAALLDAPEETTALELLTMFANAGTFLVVAIVAGGLAERFHATRRQLETQRRDLRDLEVFKDLVFECIGTGLVAVDRDQRVTAFNRAAVQMTGIPVETAIGQPWAAIFGDVLSLGAVERAIVAEPVAMARQEVMLHRADGTDIPLRLTFSALNAADGDRIGLICACEDLSALRIMEQRLRQADRLATLGRLSANIAHEIRNPLAALTGAIEVLATNAAGMEIRDRLAQIVVKESGRLNTILRQFLEYARPAPLLRAHVNVSESIDEVLVLLEHQAPAGTLKVVREFPPALHWDVDPQQFRQIVWNVCLNAVEAMPDGGEVRVEAAVIVDHLLLRVSDTGEGIASENRDHVFEPFFSTKPDGTGLGLSFVHRIVQEHGGDVDVQSEVGDGTIVSVRIPGDRG